MFEHKEYDDEIPKVWYSSNSNKLQRVRLILRMYSVLGLMVSVGAIGYFLLTFLPVDLTLNQRLAVIVAGVGLLLSLTSILMLEYYAATLVVREQEWQQAEFIKTWIDFEQASRAAIGDEEKYTRSSIRSILKELRDEGKITDDDLELLEDALKARNSIVHGARTVSQKVLDNMTSSLSTIIRQLI